MCIFITLIIIVYQLPIINFKSGNTILIHMGWMRCKECFITMTSYEHWEIERTHAVMFFVGYLILKHNFAEDKF